MTFKGRWLLTLIGLSMTISCCRNISLPSVIFPLDFVEVGLRQRSEKIYIQRAVCVLPREVPRVDMLTGLNLKPVAVMVDAKELISGVPKKASWEGSQCEQKKSKVSLVRNCLYPPRDRDPILGGYYARYKDLGYKAVINLMQC